MTFCTISVTQDFHVPPERAFDAWLQPALIEKWILGALPPGQEEIVRLESDARAGGRFSFAVKRQGNPIDHVGEYRHFDRPHRLQFTWGVAGHSSGDHSVVTVDYAKTPAGCTATLTHEMDPKWSGYAERTRAGWTKILAAQAASFR